VVSNSVPYYVNEDIEIEEIKSKYGLSNLYNIDQLKDKYSLSDTYVRAGLDPLRIGNSENINYSDFYNLYTGATYKYPVEVNGQEIFSYFPCKEYQAGKGFKRPIISFKNSRIKKSV